MAGRGKLIKEGNEQRLARMARRVKVFLLEVVARVSNIILGWPEAMANGAVASISANPKM